MRSLIIVSLVLIAFGTAQAQSWSNNFGIGYGFTSPTGAMSRYIRNGNGLSMNLLFMDPSHRIAVGPEFAYTTYGHSKSRQDYAFPDGTVAPMNLIVNNSFINLMGTARLYFLCDGPIRPYVTVKAGYSFFTTRLSIVDPEQGDTCEPVDSDILMRDGTMIYSAGGGSRMDLACLFKKLEKNRMFVDFSITMTQGGRVNYMNEDAPDPQKPLSSSTRVKEVPAEFINTQTQVVHQHHVGYLYNSFVQLMDFRLGMTYNISR